MLQDSEHSPSRRVPHSAVPVEQPPAVAQSSKTLDTFQFEVGAGKHLAVSSADSAPAQASVEPLPRISPPAATAVPADFASVARMNLARTPIVSQATARKFPSLSASLLLHAGLLLGLAVAHFSISGPQVDFSLSLDSETQLEEGITLDDVLIDTWEPATEEVSQLTSEIEQASFETAQELNAQVELADLTGSPGQGLPGLEPLSELIPASGSLLESMMPTGEELTASFFGMQVEGRRIVYVVDNSGGMRGGELETLNQELLRSVDSLNHEQEFYVIFYSDMLYPLFYPRPVQRFVPANDRFKQRLRNWLETVEFCLGNQVDQAIQAAAMIRPDVVYLLTDGDLDSTRDQRRLNALLNAQGREFVIHTFGLGTGDTSRAAEKLRQVAEANQGTFRSVKISDQAKQAATEKDRPYHDKAPGKEWGLNVGRGWGKR